MVNMKTTMSLVVVAALTLTGCSTATTNSNDTKDAASTTSWEASAFPSAAMGSPDEVIPAGTYDFTFTRTTPFDDGSPSETIKASGRITLGADTCALSADVETVSGGKPGKFKVAKAADAGIHVYNYAAKQWETDPLSITFMPLMTYAGAGLTPRADIYGSFCVLNGIALIAEKWDNTDGVDRYLINENALNEYTKANADWYVNEILDALSYAGDTREAAVKTIQKHFGLDAIDVSYQVGGVFTVARNAKGVITVAGGQGENDDLDTGTFVLTPTKAPVKVTIPAEDVPALWTEMIVNGIDAAGGLDKYMGGSKEPAKK